MIVILNRHKFLFLKYFSLGATVIIASRKLERLESAAKSFNEKCDNKDTGRIIPLQCNIRSQEDVKTSVQKIISDHKKIDLLVNNAGGQFLSPFEVS